ncbi:unnamed protein product [Pedinophyceae sp. YPF-701]|nr:unnamed protein product [Pedinophyceae sp. YPF-701]
MSGDVVRGTRLTYAIESADWVASDVAIRILDGGRPFASGAMRDCVRCQELDPDGATIPSVAKALRPGSGLPPAAVFDEAMTQAVAEAFAQEFNRRVQPLGFPTVAFLPVGVVSCAGAAARVGGRPQRVLALEPELRGQYVKYNTNDGSVVGDAASSSAGGVAQAFSHFTYEASGRQLVVCDIQGVGTCFTDPQVHSRDGQGFGAGNLGDRGLRAFAATHRCAGVCRAMGLVPARSETAGERARLEVDEDLAWRLAREEAAGADAGECRGAVGLQEVCTPTWYRATVTRGAARLGMR